MDDIISFDALYKSMKKCQKGVIWKDSTIHFVHNAVEEVIKLHDQLQNGTYAPRSLRSFYVTNPRRREVMGVSFRDRVFQRSLNDNAIYPIITKSLIYDNAACQKDKGTDFSRRRLTCFLQRFYRQHGTNGYVLQCDISGYYPNMRHDAVERTFDRYLTPDVATMAKKVLNWQYKGDVGYLPGSQMIQIAGIAVLNDLDHFIKERLHVKYYIRYMDDFILIHEDPNYLTKCKVTIENELDKLGFQLHPKKTKIYKITDGIKFLGFTHKLTETGKVIALIIPKNVKAERKKLYRLVQKSKRGEISREKVDQCYASWRNHASKGNTHNLLKRMDTYYHSLWL